MVKVLSDEWENESALRAYGVVPGPMRSPLRLKTHPGSHLAAQVQAADLVPLYLELLTQEPAPPGGIILAPEWLKGHPPQVLVEGAAT